MFGVHYPMFFSDPGYVGRLRWVAEMMREGLVGDLRSLCLRGNGFPGAMVSGFTCADDPFYRYHSR